MVSLIVVDTSNYFNPRVPCGTRPPVVSISGRPLDFNPRVPCGTRHSATTGITLYCGISIHASHAGRDFQQQTNLHVLINFNPRVPCGTRPVLEFLAGCCPNFNPRVPCGTRPRTKLIIVRKQKFQSTRPMRDATIKRVVLEVMSEHFNPRVPCGTRRG